MFAWLKRRRARRHQAEQMRRLDQAELQAALSKLHQTRNNVEQLMSKMLEERRA